MALKRLAILPLLLSGAVCLAQTTALSVDGKTICATGGVLSICAGYTAPVTLPTSPTFTNVTITGDLNLAGSGTPIAPGILWAWETPVGSTVAVPTPVPVSSAGTGPAGPQGATGATGPAGPQGPAAASPVLYSVSVPAASLVAGGTSTSAAVTISGLDTTSGSIPIAFPQVSPGSPYFWKVNVSGSAVTVTVINLTTATQSFPKTTFSVKVY